MNLPISTSTIMLLRAPTFLKGIVTLSVDQIKTERERFDATMIRRLCLSDREKLRLFLLSTPAPSLHFVPRPASASPEVLSGVRCAASPESRTASRPRGRSTNNTPSEKVVPREWYAHAHKKDKMNLILLCSLRHHGVWIDVPPCLGWPRLDETEYHHTAGTRDPSTLRGLNHGDASTCLSSKCWWTSAETPMGSTGFIDSSSTVVRPGEGSAQLQILRLETAPRVVPLPKYRPARAPCLSVCACR